MSLRKRRFLGELTKKDLTRKLVAGGVIIGMLLAVWLMLPGAIDALFGGSRGGYKTHDVVPPDQTIYELDAIPFEPRIVIDPDKITPDLLDKLRDLIDPQDIDIPSDFSGFDLSNFDVPVFYVSDVGTPLPDYRPIMRQNAYDTISGAGTEWTRSRTTVAPIDPVKSIGYGWPNREVTFEMNATESLNLRLPVFPYTPKYVDDSMKYVTSSVTDYIPDDSALYNDTYDCVEARAYSLPTYGSPANFTYAIYHDPAMTITEEQNYRTGVYPSTNPSVLAYTSYAPYLQIPGVTAARDLSPYLSTHPRFNEAYTYLSVNRGVDKFTTPTDIILSEIVTYLYLHYDVFTTFPERPGDGQDMIEWFLNRPNTSHPNASGMPYDFAAAFTMLARAFDVPARLATGYYDWDGDGVVTISNVYAWAEAYVPQSGPAPSRWITYEFLPGYTSMEELQNFLSTAILWIDTPALNEVFASVEDIPLDLRMFTNATINSLWYSVDGGPNVTISAPIVPIPGYTGYFYLNTTFDVATPGVHVVQAYMDTSAGVVSSLPATFIVNQETGFFLNIASPVNNSVQVSSTIALDYTAVNASRITAVLVNVYYRWNGTLAYSGNLSSPLASQVTSFELTPLGDFTLLLIAFTELGMFTSASTPGFVYFSRPGMPDAWFFPSSTIVPLSQPVTFIHAGSNGDLPATWQWDFGDGTPNSTIENPTHVYTATGSYNVTLTVTDADGDVSTVTRPFVVVVVPNQVPDPVVVVNATHILPGQSVQFTHVGDPGEPPVTRSWDFGDGSPDGGNITSVVHQYTVEGNYTAVFSITDGNGDTATYPVLIVVSSDLFPSAAFLANGSATSLFITSGDFVQFTHIGSNGDIPATWQWDFGDGSLNSTVEHPLHQYTSSGSRTVTLTVTDADGDQAVYHWVGCVYVDVLATELTVDFTPKDVEIFQTITISGKLGYANGTGIGGQTIDITIEYYLGSTLQRFDTTVAVTDPGTGLYSTTFQILTSSDYIRVVASFVGTGLLLSSGAQVQG